MSETRPNVTLGSVRRLVAEVLWLPEGAIDPDTPLVELGLDSAMAIELTVRIEESFDLDLPHEVAARLQTTTQIVGFLEATCR